MKHKQEIYADRNAVVLAYLAALKDFGFPVYWREADQYKWPVVVARIDQGEVGWHFPRDHESTHPRYDGPVLEDHTDWLPEVEEEYEYYSREEKNRRLVEFAKHGPENTEQ